MFAAFKSETYTFYTKSDDGVRLTVNGKVLIDKLVPQGELKEKAPEHPVVSAVKRVLKPGSATTDRIVVRGIVKQG